MRVFLVSPKRCNIFWYWRSTNSLEGTRIYINHRISWGYDPTSIHIKNFKFNKYWYRTSITQKSKCDNKNNNYNYSYCKKSKSASSYFCCTYIKQTICWSWKIYCLLQIQRCLPDAIFESTAVCWILVWHLAIYLFDSWALLPYIFAVYLSIANVW